MPRSRRHAVTSAGLAARVALLGPAGLLGFLGLLGGAALRPGDAAAHVAPSVDDNNRYLKLTPLGDRIRLAYIVFFGEVPGARMRPSLDTNRDGAIAEAEGQAFAARLAGEIAASLEVTVDGVRHPVAWAVTAAGLGSPRITAGAFSVDLVAYLCLPRARGSHALRLVDRFRLPRPGETEVRIESGPGIRIERARAGPHAAVDGELRFAGPAAPLGDPGLDLAFTAGSAAPVADDGACSAGEKAATGRGSRGAAAIAIAAAAATVAAAGAAVAVARARRRRRGGGGGGGGGGSRNLDSRGRVT